MRGMILAALKNRSGTQFSHKTDKSHIQNRDEKDEAGDDNHGRMAEKGAALSTGRRLHNDRQAGQHKPDKKAAGIAHKNRGGVKIKDQKAHQAAQVTRDQELNRNT